MAASLEDYVISGPTDPTTSTVGTVGQFYRNYNTNFYFKCTAASGGVYTWKPSVVNLYYNYDS